jgi:hypothetical protein
MENTELIKIEIAYEKYIKALKKLPACPNSSLAIQKALESMLCAREAHDRRYE